MSKLAEDGVDDGWRIPAEMWERIAPLLPPERPHPKGGRPWTPARQCMDGIFYVLRTGCRWKALPRCFGAASTVHLRFQQWRAAGVFERLWQEGLTEYDACLVQDPSLLSSVRADVPFPDRFQVFPYAASGHVTSR